MRYTFAMNKLLNDLGNEYKILYKYYLDHYFESFEEPSFKNVKMRKIWFLLLVDGLCEEIRQKGKNKKLAKLQLRKLIIHNSKWFECISKGLPEPEIRTIEKAEGMVKIIKKDKDHIQIKDQNGNIVDISNQYIDYWCSQKNNYWENEFGIEYPLYEISADYGHEKVYKRFMKREENYE